jgi:Cu+-exporting ATPase
MNINVLSPDSNIPETRKLQLKIGGMACSFCVASITKALGRMDGVRSVNVNLAHEEALIEFNPAVVTAGELRETLRDLGYTIRDPNKVRAYEEQEAEIKEHRDNLLFAAALAAISLTAMTLMWFEWLPPRGMAALYWLMPTLALATVFGPGWHILTMAWASLRRGILNQHCCSNSARSRVLSVDSSAMSTPSFPRPIFLASPCS